MGRALKYDLPGPDGRISPDDACEKGWDATFGGTLPRPLRFAFEIGFGGGEFLIECAARDRQLATVGVEYSRKRLLKSARKLARTDLDNVRLLLSTGEAFVGELLPDASVAECWINFPDPWPKKRHQRRRLLTPDFVKLLSRRLAPGGSVQVATDHLGYAEVIDAALSGEPELANAYAPRPFLREVEGRTPTRYEQTWRAEGRPLYFWHYRSPESA